MIMGRCAWASGQGLALGQRAVDGKANEIVAILALLEAPHLEGLSLTLDTAGRRGDIAERIRAKGSDHLPVLKADPGRASLPHLIGHPAMLRAQSPSW